jgi:hypothetical protein
VVVPIRERLSGKSISVAATQLGASWRRPDRDGTEPGFRSGLSLELMSLTSSTATTRAVTRAYCAHKKKHRTRRPSEIRTPLVRALAPHDVSGTPEATLAQPLSREELS